MAQIKENIKIVTEEQYYAYSGPFGRVRISFKNERNPIYLVYKERPNGRDLSRFLTESLHILEDEYTETWFEKE